MSFCQIVSSDGSKLWTISFISKCAVTIIFHSTHDIPLMNSGEENRDYMPASLPRQVTLSLLEMYNSHVTSSFFNLCLCFYFDTSFQMSLSVALHFKLSHFLAKLQPYRAPGYIQRMDSSFQKLWLF